MLTGTASPRLQMLTKRIFMVPSDIMLLEGVCENTARNLYRTILILSDKVPERSKDVKTAKRERAIKLSVKDYARYLNCEEEYISSKLPDVPLQIKEVPRKTFSL